MITKACLLLDIQGGHLMPKYLDQLLQNVGNMEWNVGMWMRGNDVQPSTNVSDSVPRMVTLMTDE